MGEPGGQSGLAGVKRADGVPHPEQHVGQALLPVPRVGEDGGDDVSQQRGVRRLELFHRAILTGLQGVDQLHILHNVPLPFLRMSYYTPETAKSHKNFLQN